MRKRGTNKHYVYTTPSPTSVQKARNRLRERTYRSTRNKDLDELITSLNRLLRGWANYFRHGVRFPPNTGHLRWGVSDLDLARCGGSQR
jgi:RNA-directed DNA polymerase